MEEELWDKEPKEVILGIFFFGGWNIFFSPSNSSWKWKTAGILRKHLYCSYYWRYANFFNGGRKGMMFYFFLELDGRAPGFENCAVFEFARFF